MVIHGGPVQWLQIDGYSIGIESETSNLKGAGAAVGKAVAGEFTLQFGDSRAAVDLIPKLFQGVGLDEVDIVTYVRTPTGPQLVQQYELSDAFVTGVATAASQDGATQTTLSLVYCELAQGISPLGRDGKPRSQPPFEWDIANGQLATQHAKVPVTGIDLSLTIAVIPSTTPLE
ncbi:MAG: type VI secretion system tube protein Hcp [Sphingomonadaceae bacterium]